MKVLRISSTAFVLFFGDVVFDHDLHAEAHVIERGADREQVSTALNGSAT